MNIAICMDYGKHERIVGKTAFQAVFLFEVFPLKAAGKIALYNARENETNLKVISSIMGHKDIQITMDIYPANKGLLFLRKRMTM